MYKYRKKPVEIEAMQFTAVDKDRVYNWVTGARSASWEGYKPVLKIQTLEGVMVARLGDYVIKGVNGEFYPCKPDIFEKTYEKVENNKEEGEKNNMRKLSTIQKREKLNDVYALDEKGNGGANHAYEVSWTEKGNQLRSSAQLYFQNGARHMEGSKNGLLDTDLLEIVRDRLKGFQSGGLSTRETAIALTHIEEALLWLNKRVEDRIERNVLGTNKK